MLYQMFSLHTFNSYTSHVGGNPQKRNSDDFENQAKRRVKRDDGEDEATESPPAEKVHD